MQSNVDNGLNIPPSRTDASLWNDFVSSMKVLWHVALSWGWMGIAIGAPLAWGFLPFGYARVKEVAAIKALPNLTVFMRMLLATLASALVLGAWVAVGKIVCRKNDNGTSWFDNMWTQTKSAAKRHWWKLLLLSVLYVLARILEMMLLLGYEPKGVGESVVKALQEYGYFLGLLFVILLPTRKLRNFSVVDVLVWVSTLVMVLSSGVLNLTAREHIDCWDSVGIMTVFALIVSVLGFFAALMKTYGSLASEYSEDVKQHGFASSVFASLTMNFSMCFGAAFLSALSLVVEFVAKGWTWGQYGDKNDAYCMNDALWGYFGDGRWFWFVVMVVLVGSIVAPVCQLAGITLHDDSMRKRKLERYGLSGKDWLIVCGGFEPMFVVLIGFFVGAAFKSVFSIVLAFALVLAIAMLRVVKVWSEKNAALRNAIFTAIRGSSRGPDLSLSAASLRLRAEKLALLKFYDKRHELRGCKLGVWTKPKSLHNLDRYTAVTTFLNKEEIRRDHMEYFYVSLVGAERFFTQDDPFTHTALGAQFDWLKRLYPKVEITSFSYALKAYCMGNCKWTADDGSGLKQVACEHDDTATPFLLAADSQEAANAFCESWNDLLAHLQDVVCLEKVSQCVNDMMMDPSNIKEP